MIPENPDFGGKNMIREVTREEIPACAEIRRRKTQGRKQK